MFLELCIKEDVVFFLNSLVRCYLIIFLCRFPCFLFKIRFQSTAADSSEQSSTTRSFEEMISPSTFKVTRDFLWGGRYHKKDFSQILNLMKEDYGSIHRWPAMFGREGMVVTHNPEDFEKIFRNEGIWPERRGSETLQHHRTNYRSSYFQGVEGLISS